MTSTPGRPRRRSASSEPPRRSRPLEPGPWLLLASFLSGVAALNYELLWMRELTLVSGSTQAAISAVLSVYFLGLALGNALASRLLGRLRRPLLVYVGIELLIALWALAFEPLQARMGSLYGALYAGLPPGSGLIHLLRMAGAASLLLVPATCMGATLPLLASRAPGDVTETSRWSGRVYGLNTLGAMVGTFATGFLLVEYLGVSLPLRLSGLLNLACALLVWPWARQAHPLPEAAGEAGRPARATRLVVAFGLLGLANLASEVLWTAFYSLIFPNDTYVYSTILIMFLLGVGAGSLAGERWLARIRRPGFVLGLLQVVSAAASLAMLAYVPALARALAPTSSIFSQQLLRYFLCIGAGTLVPTLCMGMSFPLLMRVALDRPEQTGGLVGRALAWNTLGGVLGSLLGSFVLLDRLGLFPGLLVTAGLTAAVGLALCLARPEDRPATWRLLAAAGLPLVLLFALVRPRIPVSLFELHFRPGAGTRLLATKSSVHGTVAITEELNGVRLVWINSAWVANERTHLAFGYAPWLLHKGPVHSALGICCGTGRTFGALLNAGVQDLDLVDINPAVIELSRTWLGRANHGVLSDPRPRIIIDDGRNFIRYGTKRYDVITLEPLQMFQKGVVSFYTEEFYRETRRRLQPGGVVCQWVPLYLMDPQSFASVVRTFVQVFPNAILWGRRQEAMVLLGFHDEAPVPPLDEAELRARMALPAIQGDLRQEKLFHPTDPMAYVLVQGERLRALGEGGEVYTDDRPTLEFTAARRLATPNENLRQVLEALVPLQPLFRFPDPALAGELEELRRLNLLTSFTGADQKVLQDGLLGVRRRILARLGEGGRLVYPDPVATLRPVQLEGKWYLMGVADDGTGTGQGRIEPGGLPTPYASSGWFVVGPVEGGRTYRVTVPAREGGRQATAEAAVP